MMSVPTAICPDAVAMRGSGGSQIGYIGVQSRRRLDPSVDERAALSIFGARAAAEIERRRHEVVLRAREAEIAASRVRIVEAADEERRRIGRNLHDGAQQRLLAVGNLLRLAQRTLDEENEVADVLRVACDELGEAQAELRTLARGLHPVALAERGLRSALESLTVGDELSVTLEVGAAELPEDVELAAYFIVSEALTNARRYAGADAVSIRVAPVAEGLLVEVADDGAGGADPASGTGLRGLADRIDSLGGRLELDSAPGAGTRISARLPLSGRG